VGGGGNFTRAERTQGPRGTPEEAPPVNDEVGWIALASADLD
jgi:hypothetical protein